MGADETSTKETLGQGVGLDDLLGGLLGGQGGSGGLGDILGGLTGGGGSSSGTEQSGRGGAGMLAALLPMLGSLLADGGLNKILAGFQQKALQARPTPGSEPTPNEQPSPSQVGEGDRRAGDRPDRPAARHLHDEACAAIGKVLPELVDRVSPEGHLPAQPDLDDLFGQLAHAGSSAR